MSKVKEKVKEYVSTKTMASELDLKPRTLQDWCKQQKFKAEKMQNGDWRAERKDWEEYKARKVFGKAS